MNVQFNIVIRGGFDRIRKFCREYFSDECHIAPNPIKYSPFHDNGEQDTAWKKHSPGYGIDFILIKSEVSEKYFTYNRSARPLERLNTFANNFQVESAFTAGQYFQLEAIEYMIENNYDLEFDVYYGSEDEKLSEMMFGRYGVVYLRSKKPGLKERREYYENVFNS